MHAGHASPIKAVNLHQSTPMVRENLKEYRPDSNAKKQPGEIVSHAGGENKIPGKMISPYKGWRNRGNSEDSSACHPRK